MTSIIKQLHIYINNHIMDDVKLKLKLKLLHADDKVKVKKYKTPFLTLTPQTLHITKMMTFNHIKSAKVFLLFQKFAFLFSYRFISSTQILHIHLNHIFSKPICTINDLRPWSQTSIKKKHAAYYYNCCKYTKTLEQFDT